MEHIQNKVAWALVVALSLLVIAALAGVVRGGPLDPSAPPGSTGKNVITQLPWTIDQPGSYVLNSNLTGVAGQDGITVSASNVTIDLQGFELVGVDNSLAGISASSFANVAVRNGTVRSWEGDGIALAGSGAQVDQMRSTGNGGIGISTGANSGIRDSIASNNAGIEIAIGTAGNLENCTADGNGTVGDGIQIGAGGTMRGCVARNNGGVEISAGERSIVQDCVADGSATGGNGIDLGESAHLRNCTATNNGGNEINAGNFALIEDCVADGAGDGAPPAPYGGPGEGIHLDSWSVVRGCTVFSNAGAGIFAVKVNRLDNNYVTSNDGIGIYLFDYSNTGFGNSVKGNLGGFQCFVAANNDFIEITDPVGATNPWSNLC